MKKLLALLLTALLLLSLAACGAGNTGEEEAQNGESVSQTTGEGGETTGVPETTKEMSSGETEGADDSLPTVGLPLGWEENEYTALVPTPNSGGKVMTSGMVGALYAIELKWSMEQGLAYAQLLQDAGFGEDCVEKYQKGGYIDRTANGINVQLMDVFGVTSLTIMKVEQ